MCSCWIALSLETPNKKYEIVFDTSSMHADWVPESSCTRRHEEGVRLVIVSWQDTYLRNYVQVASITFHAMPQCKLVNAIWSGFWLTCSLYHVKTCMWLYVCWRFYSSSAWLFLLTCCGFSISVYVYCFRFVMFYFCGLGFSSIAICIQHLEVCELTELKRDPKKGPRRAPKWPQWQDQAGTCLGSALGPVWGVVRGVILGFPRPF